MGIALSLSVFDLCRWMKPLPPKTSSHFSLPRLSARTPRQRLQARVGVLRVRSRAVDVGQDGHRCRKSQSGQAGLLNKGIRRVVYLHLQSIPLGWFQGSRAPKSIQSRIYLRGTDDVNS